MRNDKRARRSGSILLAALLALGFAACGDDEDPTETGTGTEETTAPEGDAGAGTTAATTGEYRDDEGDTGGGAGCEGAELGTEIDISNFAFVPDCMSATPGSEITVTNSDGTRHTITAEDDSFDLELGGDESGTITAPSTPDTYRYQCDIHPTMIGTLVVS